MPDARASSDSPPPLAEQRLRAAEESVRKCRTGLEMVGENAELDRVLAGIKRRLGTERFISADDLAAIQNAVGWSVNLSQRDLETCAQAVHGQALLVARTATASATDGAGCPFPGPCCAPGYSACIGTTGNAICCNDQDSVCSQTCGIRGQCEPWCERRWCFPAEATARLETGMQTAMKDLAVGDRVLVTRADGSLAYEDIYLFTHRDGKGRGRYLDITLASGQRLSLSPRHFVPMAEGTRGSWASRVVKAADEVRVGDMVWHAGGTGSMSLAEVTAVTERVGHGAFNPLTFSGTIVVDGVVASAHSDWFLDGIVSAAVQARVDQALFAPVRVIYRLIGPQWMVRITEDWGVVDAVRDWTSSPALVATLLGALLALFSLAMAFALRRARARRRPAPGSVSTGGSFAPRRLIAP